MNISNLRQILQSQASLLNHASRRAFTLSMNQKPWFVDEDEGENEVSVQKPAPKIRIPEPPAGAPPQVSRAYQFLANSPLVEPTTVTAGPPQSADAQPDGNFPFPILKKVLKARGKNRERGFGQGVGEGLGQGVFRWQVIAQVKDGIEGRGGVEAVASSLRTTLRKEFPALHIPSTLGQKDQKDRWAMVDMGDSAVHICSRKAWQRWMDPSREW
ncbi:hypothetical protein FRC15_010290 [Serendipita sp. 397]|nr:hypothetical protein FRC15_010290 [Serendipita sp. 397]